MSHKIGGAPCPWACARPSFYPCEKARSEVFVSSSEKSYSAALIRSRISCTFCGILWTLIRDLYPFMPKRLRGVFSPNTCFDRAEYCLIWPKLSSLKYVRMKLFFCRVNRRLTFIAGRMAPRLQCSDVLVERKYKTFSFSRGYHSLFMESPDSLWLLLIVDEPIEQPAF